jgi:hypothetical protein
MKVMQKNLCGRSYSPEVKKENATNHTALIKAGFLSKGFCLHSPGQKKFFRKLLAFSLPLP